MKSYIRVQQWTLRGLVGGSLVCFSLWVMRGSSPHLSVWQDTLYYGLLSLALVAGLVILTMCIPGLCYVRLTYNGVTEQVVWHTNHASWPSVTSMEEDWVTTGKGGWAWGVRVQAKYEDGSDNSFFIRDMYSIRRADLLLLMQQLKAQTADSIS